MNSSRAIDATTLILARAPPSTACDDFRYCRSLPSIVFSCASTMFLCTWITLRPSVPKDPREAWWKKLFGRIGLMVLAFIAPEVVLFFAFKEWTESCNKLKGLLGKAPDCGWTETHAMFASSGGFRLVEEDGTVRPLDGKTFFHMIQKDEIEIPDISEDEIRDRSKGDNIAKAITAIHVLWFGSQVAYRAIEGLGVATLELTTVGHVVLNAFIYCFWWNKPHNVKFPTNVHAKKHWNPRPRDASMILSRKGSADRELESRMPGRYPLPLRVRVATLSNGELLSDLLTLPIGLILFLTMLVIFGVIHCLAWDFVFPTGMQRMLWRDCAVVVTAAPTLALIVWLNLDGIFKMFLEFLLTFSYSLARICLLALALVALRDLPYKAYEIPSWLPYVPHIS